MSSALRFVLLSALCFSLMGACFKALRGTIGADQIVFFRGVISLAMSYAFLPRTAPSDPGTGRRPRYGLLLARGLLGYCGLQLYVVALGSIPYPDAAALLYTSPVFTTLFAAWSLGEALSRRAAVALGLCLGGALLVLKPEFEGALVPGLLALLAGISSGAAYVCVRAASKTESERAIILAFPLVALPISGARMVGEWVAPDAMQWTLLLVAGVLSQFGQIGLTRALRSGAAGPVTTGYYITLALAAVWSLLWFDEPIGWLTLGGSLLILLGVSNLRK